MEHFLCICVCLCLCVCVCVWVCVCARERARVTPSVMYLSTSWNIWFNPRHGQEFFSSPPSAELCGHPASCPIVFGVKAAEAWSCSHLHPVPRWSSTATLPYGFMGRYLAQGHIYHTCTFTFIRLFMEGDFSMSAWVSCCCCGLKLTVLQFCFVNSVKRHRCGISQSQNIF
jgi:hypothetical protein